MLRLRFDPIFFTILCVALCVLYYALPWMDGRLAR
jgi:hypothetical protein